MLRQIYSSVSTISNKKENEEKRQTTSEKLTLSLIRYFLL